MMFFWIYKSDHLKNMSDNLPCLPSLISGHAGFDIGACRGPVFKVGRVTATLTGPRQ